MVNLELFAATLRWLVDRYGNHALSTEELEDIQERLNEVESVYVTACSR